MSLADETQGVQVKLWNSLTIRLKRRFVWMRYTDRHYLYHYLYSHLKTRTSFGSYFHWLCKMTVSCNIFVITDHHDDWLVAAAAAAGRIFSERWRSVNNTYWWWNLQWRSDATKRHNKITSQSTANHASSWYVPFRMICELVLPRTCGQ